MYLAGSAPVPPPDGARSRLPLPEKMPPIPHPKARLALAATAALALPALPAGSAHLDVMDDSFLSFAGSPTAGAAVRVNGVSSASALVVDTSLNFGVSGDVILGNDRGLRLTYTGTGDFGPFDDDGDVVPPQAVGFPEIPDDLFVPDERAAYAYRPDGDFGGIAYFNTANALSTLELFYLESVFDLPDSGDATPGGPSNFLQAGEPADSDEPVNTFDGVTDDAFASDALEFTFADIFAPDVDGFDPDGPLGFLTLALTDTDDTTIAATGPVFGDTGVLTIEYDDFDSAGDLDFTQITGAVVTLETVRPGAGFVFEGIRFRPVPEPASAAVGLVGAGLLTLRRRRA